MTGNRDVNAKKGSINYKIRLTVQTLVFAAFICLLVYADPIAEKDGMVDIFLRMSPLSAIGAMVAAKEFIVRYWPAVGYVLLELLLIFLMVYLKNREREFRIRFMTAKG